MINRIRAVRREKGWTLADLAQACDPSTTAQTIGRLETGTRTLSVPWMERIAAALGVHAEALLEASDDSTPPIVAALGARGAEAPASARHAVFLSHMGGDAPVVVLTVEIAAGPYLPGDQVWLRQLDPTGATPAHIQPLARAINRDVLVPKGGGGFAFGRLIDRRGEDVGILPVLSGHKQEVIRRPAWIAVAETLVRRL